MNKEQVVFYLNRVLKNAESRATVDHESAARAGISYEQRAIRQRQADASKQEADALRKAMEVVKEHMER